MLRTSFALMILLLLNSRVVALDLRSGQELVPDGGSVQTEQLKKQKRRDVLREALKLPVEDAPITTRQMSLQEKAALRQQLQEQRQELLK